jgi:hypothetical protein
LRTPCRVEGDDPDSKRSAGSSKNTLGKLFVCLPGNRGRGVAAPSKREVGLVGGPQRTPPKVIFGNYCGRRAEWGDLTDLLAGSAEAV